MVGKSLLHYEVLESIGKGGMGEVFKARDTKLGRQVALKVLPPELVGDPEREARFQREARSLASLQHPNVASVYGFEEAADTRFLVMELISGTELTDLIQKGPVPIEDTLAIARQMAAGLEAAHEAGIVHRDLKPANIMINNEGEVKILDFGLAQAWFGDADAAQGSTTNPTLTAAMTQVGAVLGTAAYMSPEQARGTNVDRRSDIWAFGTILFEMLTGKPLFKGDTISDTLAAVLRAEPDWDTLPAEEAPGLCQLVARCLIRDPRQRLRDIGEARIFLQDGDASSTILSFSNLGLLPTEDAAPARRLPVALLALVALLSLGLGGALGWKVLAHTDPPPVLHTMLPPPGSTEYDLKGAAPGAAALSPDGKMVAFAARDGEGMTLLYLRHLDKGESVALSGTEGAAYPFWSPDSKFIGYFDNNDSKLRKVAVAGGPPVTLCTAENMKGGSWNESGQIIFAPDASSGIFTVPAIGGEPQQLTTLTEGFNSHRHPRFLPGGQEFLFVARNPSSSEGNTVFRASLDTSVVPAAVSRTQSNFEFGNGHLLTVRENVLMATPFHVDQERVIEGGTPIVENTLTIPGAALSVFSVSRTGMIVYQTGASATAGQQLFLTDLDGGGKTPLGGTGQIFHPVVAPNGKLAVVQDRETSGEGIDLWLVDLETGLRNRFTFHRGDEFFPCWSPDGQKLYYTSSDSGINRLMQKPVEGLGGETILLETELAVAPSSVSPDGRYLLLYGEPEEGGRFEVHQLDLQDPAAEPTVFCTLPDANCGGGIYSPDGRWVAYHANTASGWDIFVMPAGGGPRKWQVSTVGAVYPKWNNDGSELLINLFSGDIRVYSVDGTGDTFRIGPHRASVTVPGPTADGCNYDLLPDGRRIIHTGSDADFRPDVSFLHLVTDWQRGLVQ